MYDELRCITMSYCGLVLFPPISSTFLSNIASLLLELKLLMCNLSPAYAIWHTVEVGLHLILQA
jgi:hypothetical protein